MSHTTFGPISWERMIGAVEDVRNRLERATAALEKAGIDYAVIGGNAVAAWVSRVDRAAVRNTRDVDLLLRREDLEAAKLALAPAGFIYRHVRSIDMFLDGPGAKARDAVHILFAGEKVREDDPATTPTMSEVEQDQAFRIVTLEALVRMKLTSFRRKDQVHLLDMVELGLIDANWPDRFTTVLADRLQQLLDDPDG
ncbi:MAG: nucleotidyltransferase family protein [Planctomycetes bacterium]|nr:nucleotidyltransferase family protein [Planctomycetota bacterium]